LTAREAREIVRDVKQFRAIVSGRVQGVSYRAETVATGRRLGLRGYARNRADGSVEVVAAGEDAALDALLRFLHRGPSLARVERVEVDWADATRLEDRFDVRY
jgi:acylphosphatase